jgi:hypothetical protein
MTLEVNFWKISHTTKGWGSHTPGSWQG